MKAIFNLIMNILGIGKAYYMFGMNKPHPMWTKFFLVFPYPWKSYACLYCSNCSYSVSRHQIRQISHCKKYSGLTPASRRSKWKDWQTTLYTLRGL